MIVYSKFNLHRKKEFQLLTTIESDNNSLFSAKTSQRKESENFLNSFFSKYEKISSANFSIIPVKPQKISDMKVIFEYKDGISLDGLLFDAFTKKDKKKFLGFMEDYLNSIKDNEMTERTLSEDFEKIFGACPKKKNACLRLGCLDLNFDNIIHDEKSEKCCLIDYEWTFDFPVPYKYVVFRALSNFYFRYYSYNLNKFIDISDLYKLAEISHDEKELFIRFEYNFQDYVNENFEAVFGGFEKFRKNYFELLEKKEIAKTNSLWQKDAEIQQKDQAIQQKDAEIQQKGQVIQQKDKIIQQKNEDIRQKDATIQERNAEIAAMKSSKFWKIRGKYISLKEKLGFLKKRKESARHKEEKISIIVPNFSGKKYLKSLFESLRCQTFKNLEIIMVDNASVDGSAEYVEKTFPEVKIVKNKKNLGFAGGCDSGLPYCEGSYVALINNDMIADKHWLEKMHDAIKKHDVDAVGPKILFYKPFINLRFEIKSFIPSENSLGNDSRELGCKIASDIGIEGVDYDKIIFGQNTFGEEKDKKELFHWISNGAVIKIPIDLNLEKFILKAKMSVSGFQREEKLRIFVGEEIIFDGIVDHKFNEYKIEMDKKTVKENCRHLVNNAGSEFDPETGIGKDIGIFEDDAGQYDKAKEAFSLCGGSMLIKKSAIDKFGLFDRYFFTYYEDTDFCWRLKKEKKKFFYEPKAVVYHIHAGTSKEWSPFFRYHVERNRLAMLFKNGGMARFTKEFLSFLKRSLREKDGSVRKTNLKAAANLFFHLPILYLKRRKIIRCR